MTKLLKSSRPTMVLLNSKKITNNNFKEYKTLFEYFMEKK